MNENVKVVFGLIGGLALFLYGMNSMSDALQKAAGEKMKKILFFIVLIKMMFRLEKAQIIFPVLFIFLIPPVQRYPTI